MHGMPVGGVGTPWHLKKLSGFIETACFTCGCNFQCAQCQNWTTTYNGREILVDNYPEKVFLGVGIPYNKYLISLEEIQKMGDKIRTIDENVQVCVLDYRPAFRRSYIQRPEYDEMVNVWRILSGTGLKTVICQTARGHIWPEL
jgi:pyruvate-formate lyase-activating enzyme